MNLKILLLLLPFIAGFSYPCVDINFSPYAGAENILFLQKGLEKIDHWIDPIPTITREDLENRENVPYFSKEKIWLRQAKTIFVWIPVIATSMITQHEVFGHGYRVRDLGPQYAKVTRYTIHLLKGATHVDITSALTPSQNLAIDIAGLEADAIFANKIRLNWFNQGRIDGRQSLLYLASSLSLAGYAFSTHETPVGNPATGNDIINFLFLTNNIYNKSHLTYKDVQGYSLVNLLDPFFYYSVLSHWIYDAYRIHTPIPMFHLGPIQYLPSAKMMLTPFGLQGYLENFLLIRSIPAYLYLKFGNNGNSNYWGAGIESRKLIDWKSATLGFRLDFWRQPNVLFQQGALSAEELEALPSDAPVPPLYPTSVVEAQSSGAAFTLISTYGSPKWPLRLFMELGYKTEGYLPGEALREAPIARGGLSGQF